MTHWWISTPSFTCGVVVDDADVIRSAAPILQRFVGQPRASLVAWITRRWRTGVEIVRLGPRDEERSV